MHTTNLHDHRVADAAARRRRFLKAALGAAAAPWLAPRAHASDRLVLFTDYPFRLGVASGSPTASSVVLWTRLCPDALHDGGMGVQQVPLRWEVATDEAFGNVVRRGEWFAMAGRAHSAHVTVDGLEPDRWYHYRFMAGNDVSPTGRTRTLPLANAAPSRLRFALASCQHYELGYFSAYRHMLRDDPDLICFVGDYIYEYTAAKDRVRAHAELEPYTLAEYRARYAQYRLDADLQAMHHAVPWCMTIDDHEVMNDWAGDTGEDLDPNFVQRRADALQAYFEHVPLPMDALLSNHRLALYRAFDYGALARFHVLDDRQYRDAEACSRPGMGGSNYVTDKSCPERTRAGRTILGVDQERWLDQSFASSRARWNIIVQQSLMSTLRETSPDGPVYWTDAWDGYPSARQRVASSLLQHRVRNPLIIGGDYHCTIAADFKQDFARPESPTIATEFVGTSISSPGMPSDVLRKKMAASPHIRYGNSERRGYLLFDVKDDVVDVAVRTLDSVSTHDSACVTERRFAVADGRPGIAEV
jgi:alkaline phosphatase D